MKITQNSKFDIVHSLPDLCSSPKDAVFEVQAANPDYKVHTSRAIFTESASSYGEVTSRKIGCSFLNEKISLPSLSIYKLNDAIVYPGKVRARQGNWHSHGQLALTSEGCLFPESYGVMDGGHTLPDDLLTPEGQDEYSLIPPIPTKRLKGRYLFLGSMHDHFGHFLVEGLSRLWVLKYLTTEEVSSLNIIIYEPGLIPPATKILEYLGINKSQIHFLSEPCRVEELIAPGIAYRTHFWARGEMNFIYEKVSAAALREKPSDFPAKIFLSRNNVTSRKLNNEIELESAYRDAGYWIIRPEELPIGDQIRIAAGADSIAGCTGSNMYLAMFQKKNGFNHIFVPYDFTLKDDAMISELRGSKLVYVVGSKLSEGQWTVDTNITSELLKDETPHE